MQDLRLIGVHEDGLHLLLAGPGGEHFTVPIDDALRTAARRDRPRMGQLRIDLDGGMRPREVQSLIRAGGSSEEVADRAGWSVDKVRRYEGPILAERAHVADQARLVRVRHRGGSAGGAAPTLQGRVAQRMRERGVDPETSTWDAWRLPDATSWTVAITFAAGGRQRQASWVYDPVLRSVEAVDDEARWLSADDQPASGPLPSSPARTATVYDVEAEGGVAATTTRRPSRERPADPSGAAAPTEEPVDLMTAMRQRTTVGRRSGRRRAEPRAHVAPSLPLDGPEPEAGALAATTVETEQPGMPPAPDAEAPAGSSAHRHHEPALPGELAELEPAGAEVPPVPDDEADDRAEEPADDPADAVENVVAEVEPAADDDAGDPRRTAESAPVHPSTPETEPNPVPVAQADPEPEMEAASEPERGPASEPDVIAGVPDETPVEGEVPRTPAAKRKARTSVPSWDDIMFGAKRD